MMHSEEYNTNVKFDRIDGYFSILGAPKCQRNYFVFQLMGNEYNKPDFRVRISVYSSSLYEINMYM